jgi:glucodextranase-like protein/FecR-like protein
VPRRRSPFRLRDWYRVSVDTLRGWAIFFFLVGAGVLGYYGYRYWEQYSLEREVTRMMDEARVLIQRLESEEGLGAYRSEFHTAWSSLQQARIHFAQGELAPAIESAQRSHTLLLTILDALRHRGAAGEAQFISVQGGVEYRSGEAGSWEEARGRVVLRTGDYVKTGGGGSAEVMFVDGTLYTVRPNTLFLVTRNRGAGGTLGEQAIRVEYGWVNLNTAQRSSRVTTPNAEARVREDSEAMVAYDQASAVSRFAAYRGGVEVQAGDKRRKLGPLQQVVQTGSQLSAARPLPVAPQPVAPAENLEVDLGAVPQVVLAWRDVPGATRYALQVSRNRLFVDNVIDVDNRTRTRATLGVRGEGTFLWRVASFSREGLQGPWSTPRQIRVASLTTAGAEADKIPPVLDLDDVKSYGSIFIIAGRTEPGSRVEVNGEAVAVEADGSFTKTVQLGKEGWSFVDIRAVDSVGNQTVRRHRVFVESL